MFLNRDRFRIAFRLFQSKSLRLLFGPFERIGLHITAADFYSPIPVVRRIPEAAWAPFRNMPVPLWDEVVFNRHLNQLQQFYPEYVELLNGDVEGYDPTNLSFCPYDAQSYWGMIRSCKPRRIVEIGSGWSTRVG